MPEHVIVRITWRKASLSSQTGECVEVAIADR
ncbi:DUF397 domain-containing protein [Actinoallomurus sp. NPDC052308]